MTIDGFTAKVILSFILLYNWFTSEQISLLKVQHISLTLCLLDVWACTNSRLLPF